MLSLHSLKNCAKSTPSGAGRLPLPCREGSARDGAFRDRCAKTISFAGWISWLTAGFPKTQGFPSVCRSWLSVPCWGLRSRSPGLGQGRWAEGVDSQAPLAVPGAPREVPAWLNSLLLAPQMERELCLPRVTRRSPPRRAVWVSEFSSSFYCRGDICCLGGNHFCKMWRMMDEMKTPHPALRGQRAGGADPGPGPRHNNTPHAPGCLSSRQRQAQVWSRLGQIGLRPWSRELGALAWRAQSGLCRLLGKEERPRGVAGPGLRSWGLGAAVRMGRPDCPFIAGGTSLGCRGAHGSPQSQDRLAFPCLAPACP